MIEMSAEAGIVYLERIDNTHDNTLRYVVNNTHEYIPLRNSKFAAMFPDRFYIDL